MQALLFLLTLKCEQDPCFKRGIPIVGRGVCILYLLLFCGRIVSKDGGWKCLHMNMHAAPPQIGEFCFFSLLILSDLDLVWPTGWGKSDTDQIWASLLRSLSASSLLPAPHHALAAHERSLDSAGRWGEVAGRRFWAARRHLGRSSSSCAYSWMAPHGSSNTTCPGAEELPSWAQPAYGLLRNNQLLF